MTKELLKQVVRKITEQVKSLGFKKREGEIYTCEAAEGFLGWLGLNRAIRAGVIAINPVVGVRCQELERLLSDLRGEKAHSYVPPTISSPLGYLMPEQNFRQWFFETAEDLSQVQDLVVAFCDYGIPFIRSTVSVDALQQRFESRLDAIEPNGTYRLPLVMAMRGEKTAALQICEDILGGMGNPITADAYRRFAVALAEKR